jgi:hypothetical protein
VVAYCKIETDKNETVQNLRACELGLKSAISVRNKNLFCIVADMMTWNTGYSCVVSASLKLKLNTIILTNMAAPGRVRSHKTLRLQFHFTLENDH